MPYVQRYSEAFSNFPLLLKVLNETGPLPDGVWRSLRQWDFIYGQDDRRLRAVVYRSDSKGKYAQNGVFVTTRISWPPLDHHPRPFICNYIVPLTEFNETTANNYARFVYTAVDNVLKERHD